MTIRISNALRFILCITLLFSLPQPAPADTASSPTVTVDLLIDEFDGDVAPGDVSLREALDCVQAGGTISFDPSVTGVSAITLGELAVLRDMNIVGPGADLLTLDAQFNSRVLSIAGGTTVVLSGMSFVQGSAPSGGALLINPGAQVILDGCDLNLNQSTGILSTDGGGAIYNDQASVLLIGCTLTSNTAQNKGGAIYARAKHGFANTGLDLCLARGNTAGAGGAVFNEQKYAYTAQLRVVDTTFDANASTATWNAGGGAIHNRNGLTAVWNTTFSGNASAARGGAIFSDGDFGTILAVTNSTFSANHSTDTGGGIYTRFEAGHGGTCAFITNCTLFNNTAADGGGIHHDQYGNMAVGNTLLIGNNGTDSGGLSDVLGGAMSNGHNLLSTLDGSSGFNADELTTQPFAAILDLILQDNGGPTLTHDLALGSPALDAGDNDAVTTPTFLDPPFTDQRGADRITSGSVDIGAVEKGIPGILVEPLTLDFGTFLVADGESTPPLTFTIHSVGSAPLVFTGAGIALDQGDADRFRIVNDPSTNTLAPGASLIVEVVFDPAAMLGSPAAGVSITTDDPDEPLVTVNLSAQVLGIPNVLVEPLLLDFGSHEVGDAETTPLGFMITNVGSADLEFTGAGIALDQGDTARFRIVNMPSTDTLAPGNFVVVQTAFDPGTVIGDFASSVTVTTNDPDTPLVEVALTGATFGVPEIDVVPLLLDFGASEAGGPVTTPTLTFTVYNLGSADLIFTGAGIEISGGDATLFSLSGDSVERISRDSLPLVPPIAPGGSRVYSVNFIPGTAIGDFSSAVVITSNDADESTVNVGLLGSRFIIPLFPDIDVQPTLLNFGSAEVGGGETAPLSFTVTNVGDAPLEFTGPGIALTGGAVAQFRITNNPSTATLAPDASVTVDVAWNPQTIGLVTAQIAVTSNDPDEPDVRVDLAGTGTGTPDVEVEPQLLDFGAHLVGGGPSGILSFAIRNVGTAPLNFTGPGIDLNLGSTELFRIVNSPSTAPLAPGAMRTVDAVFEPDSVGGHEAGVSITTNDPDEALTTVTLQGLALAGQTNQDTYYFAEGQLEDSETYLLVINPSGTFAVDLEVRFYFEDRPPLTILDTAAPQQRRTFNVRHVFLQNGLPVDSIRFGARVRSLSASPAAIAQGGNGPAPLLPIFAERAVYFHPAGIYRGGGHDSVGSELLGVDWLISEGTTTRQRTTLISIMNPNPQDANLVLSFLNELQQNQQTNLICPAERRLTFLVNNLIPNDNFSALVQSINGMPVVVERTLYGGASSPQTGRISRLWGHNSMAMLATSSVWYFCEGATDRTFTTFFLIGNTNNQPVRVSLQFVPDGAGNVFTTELTIDALRRKTINVESNYPAQMTDVPAFATIVRVVDPPTAKIVAERAFYAQLPQFDDRTLGTNAIGIPEPNPVWFLPEGAVWGPDEFETRLLICNPNAQNVDVRVSLLRDTGARVVQNVTIPAMRRLTLDVNQFIAPNANTQSFSTLIEAVDGTSGLLAERTMYFKRSVFGEPLEAHTAIGIPLTNSVLITRE